VKRRYLMSVVLVALLAGCGTPAGADGNLVDEWAMLPAATVPVPVAGTCYRKGVEVRTTDMRTPVAYGEKVACTDPHVSETFYVGTIGASLADASEPPRGEALGEAFATCSTQAKEFLGDDWHNGLVDLMVMAPTTTQWRGGARYLRCDLAEIKSDLDIVAERATSLKDALRGDRPVARGCGKMVLVGEDWEDLQAVPCSAPHDAEYAGTFSSATREYPDTLDKGRNAVGNGCFAIVAKHTGTTETQLDRTKDFWMGWWLGDDDAWAYGDRIARCYVLVDSKKPISKSLKGNGTAKI
jgi:hypothetical protein